MPRLILRDDYLELDRSEHYVAPDNRKERSALIELLEKEGYTFAKYSWCDKNECLRTSLPLAINIAKKEISHMGNVACAACGCTQKVVMNVDTFIEHYLNQGI